MCELLVYARVDGPDDQLHPMRYRPGDVVVAKEDGWVWGTEELKEGGSFRVVVFHGVHESAADHLLAEWDIGKRRKHKLNVEHAALRPHPKFWQDHSHGASKVVVTQASIAELSVDKSKSV